MEIDNLKHFFTSTTGRLAASYLAIIMLMSVGFSVVFYHTSSQELGRQLPPQSFFDDRGYDGPRPLISDFFENRIAEGRHILLARLILLNIVTLLVGSGLSYYLARRTLQPIERNLEAQAQFVSDASHELRTPLTVLQTTNEVALRRKNISAEAARGVFRQNIEEVEALKTLTDSLLRLAKQDENYLVLKPVSLQDIASEGLNHIVQLAQDKQMEIQDTTQPVKVLAEKQSLVQAAIILLDNAVKYSPPKSTLHIEGYKQGKYGYLKVRDEGQGIRASELPHIFDRFYRASQSRNKQQVDGYGIGLSLAQKIMQQLDGEILVESTPGKGSTFILKLQLA
jgi:two-component system sensor histidine kinase CiaH